MPLGSQFVSTIAMIGMLSLLRLGDRDALLLRVDDEHRRRQAVHLLDAEERLLELAALAVESEPPPSW